MAPKDKPYRVYRGGRVKGKVPAVPTKTRSQPRHADASTTPPSRFGWVRGGSWKHVVLIVLLGLVILVVAWGVAGYLSFSSGVSDANKRFDRERGAKAALAKSNGFLLSHGATILLLGTDSSTVAGR